MGKRKSTGDATLPRKRAKLAQLHDTLHFQTCDVLPAPSPQSSPATSTRSEKRKRGNDSQTDLHEEPRGKKRIKTSHNPSDVARYSRSSSPDPWPSIGYVPEEEKKPNPVVEAFHRACIEAEDEETTCSCEPLTVYRNPLPSPVPSDRDATEDGGLGLTIVNATAQTLHLASKSQKIPSPKLQETSPPSSISFKRKNRSSRQGNRKRNTASSHQEQPQRRPRNKKNSSRNQLQDENSLPTIETLLQSRRSSRRDPVCQLWYLGDNGMACTVANTR